MTARTPSLRALFIPALLAAGLALGPATGDAGGTKSHRIDGFDDFDEGEVEGAAIETSGRVTRGYASESAELEHSSVFSCLSDGKQAWVGTADKATIQSISLKAGSPSAKQLVELEGVVVSAMARLPSGDLVAEGRSFDIVLALEIIEHTADPALFQEEVAALCRPGGLVIASTLNRTVASYLGGVLAAEYLLGWVPRGTHDWRKFIKPSEMAAGFRPHGLRIREMAGVSWEPTTDSFRASRDFSINYIMAFRKDG